MELTNAFKQKKLTGLPTGKVIDIDTELTISQPPSSVFVFNGQQRTR